MVGCPMAGCPIVGCPIAWRGVPLHCGVSHGMVSHCMAGCPIALWGVPLWGVPAGCRAGGAGGWSARGCEVVFRNQSHVSCQCNHMTSFAVLMDISRREVGWGELRLGARGGWDGMRCHGCVVLEAGLMGKGRGHVSGRGLWKGRGCMNGAGRGGADTWAGLPCGRGGHRVGP